MATWELVIPRRFQRASKFREGLAAVRIDRRFGFIDQRGEIVIPPTFDLAGSFHHGLAEVLVGDRTGVIDRSGKLVVEPQFARSFAFTEDILLAQPGTWRSRGDRNLDGLGDPLEMLTLQADGGNWGLYHVRNGWLTPHNLSFRIFDRQEHRYLWATTGHFLKGPFGLIGTDGKWQIEPQFADAGSMSDGLAVVRKAIGERHPVRQSDYEWVAVDQDGRLVIPFRRWQLSDWANGISIVSQDGKRGLLDKAGQLIGDRLFDDVERASTGDISTVLLDGKWVGIDRKGNILAHPPPRLVSSCPSGVKLFRKEGKIEVVGPDGQPTVPYLLDDTNPALDCQKPTPIRAGGHRGAEASGTWSYIGLDGRLLFDPPRFRTLHNYMEGHAWVEVDGKWGIIDLQGRFTVEPQYESVQRAGHDVSLVRRAGQELWLGPDGTRRAPLSQETPMERQRYLTCGPETRIVSNGSTSVDAELWGIADIDGWEIVKPNFRAIHCFQFGLAWGAIDSLRRWCPVEPDGTVHQDDWCTSEYPVLRQWSRRPRLSSDPYEDSVLWTRATLEYATGKRSELPRRHSRSQKY